MTLTDKIERVKAALANIEASAARWRAGEADASLTSEQRACLMRLMRTSEAECVGYFRGQSENITTVLTAHEASRKLVQEACNVLGPLVVQACTNDDHIYCAGIRKVHALLKAALEG